MPDPILAITKWPTNAHLIEDCARLGYLNKDWLTLDPTWGLGTFWANWQPDELIGSDIDITRSPIGRSIDFTDMPWPDLAFQAVVFDPPYKLNGTPSDSGGTDSRYGVGGTPTRWQDRMTLCRRGIAECARVSSKMLLIKCQDQVVSGKIRWQSHDFADFASGHGFDLIDKFEFLSYRPQPPGRRQVHAHRNSSQLLVMERCK